VVADGQEVSRSKRWWTMGLLLLLLLLLLWQKREVFGEWHCGLHDLGDLVGYRSEVVPDVRHVLLVSQR